MNRKERRMFGVRHVLQENGLLKLKAGQPFAVIVAVGDEHFTIDGMCHKDEFMTIREFIRNAGKALVTASETVKEFTPKVYEYGNASDENRAFILDVDKLEGGQQ